MNKYIGPILFTLPARAEIEGRILLTFFEIGPGPSLCM
jgi:hypothetical protein